MRKRIRTKYLKSSCLLKNIQNNDRKMSCFLQKHELSMNKCSYIQASWKIRFKENTQFFLVKHLY